MKEFTFVAFTYNQEKYIIQQLESIKYQIEHFGQEYEIHFLLCDDASKDRTVLLSQKWVEDHKELFVNIKFVVQEHNVGIVNNFLTALNNISTKKFKILAGDDIYFKNNLFEIAGKSNFVISPTMSFTDDFIVNISNLLYHNIFLYKQYKQKELRKYLCEYLKFDNIISAPGVLFEVDGHYEKIVDVLSPYKFIEDLPLWVYLLSKNDTKVVVSEVPVVMYRCDVGISTNKNHSRHSEYEKDLVRVNKEIYINKFKKPGILNLHKWKNSIYKKMSRFLYIKNNYIKNVNQSILKDVSETDVYLKHIIHSAECWMKSNSQ